MTNNIQFDKREFDCSCLVRFIVKYGTKNTYKLINYIF